MVRATSPRIGLGVTTAALVAVLAGCGTTGTNDAQPQPAPPTTSDPTSSSSPSASAPTATTQPDTAASTKTGEALCKSSELKLSLGHGDAGAGTVYRPLIFTNVSNHPCVIQGFPGVSYVAGEDGHQVGPAAVRQGDKGGPFTLNNGDSGYAEVGFVNVQNYDTVTCQPQMVRGLRVYPPQETASVFVPLQTTGCASDKIPGDQLTVKTIQKGSGGQ
ncbi:DUF4232 domain-containing protein [Amycolatopsis granulosa]|uniref:DUF4232 domain-containing protein n=1 Tax=Amycolatopsis granulosa TaxID=185684 RepID=UPI00312C8B02|nr:hypothetical protein [Amycolatopsis granulosa]